jgi:hypothetical protein
MNDTAILVYRVAVERNDKYRIPNYRCADHLQFYAIDQGVIMERTEMDLLITDPARTLSANGRHCYFCYRVDKSDLSAIISLFGYSSWRGEINDSAGYTFNGIDVVGVQGFFSGIALDISMGNQLQALNTNLLFDQRELAEDCAKACARRYPSHAPFYLVYVFEFRGNGQLRL